MDGLQELDDYCQANNLWLSYCSYKGQYKCYVNPGTTMTVAPWYKSREEAVKACWAAMGVKPKHEWVDVKEKTDRKSSLDYSNAKTIQVPLTMEEFDKIATRASEYIVKRRGRPKGSKNKPKAVASE